MPDIYVTLNARLRPLDRGEHFEDPLAELLPKRGVKAEVTGGGTLLSANHEPSNCDIDLAVDGDGRSALQVVIDVLEKLGAPVGSKARLEDSGPVSFGKTEGIGVYLNGTDLPDEVYASSDVNELIAALHDRLGAAGKMLSYWEGPTETALYFYGPSAAQIRGKMAGVLSSHPLAQRCRIEFLTPTAAS